MTGDGAYLTVSVLYSSYALGFVRFAGGVHPSRRPQQMWGWGVANLGNRVVPRDLR